MSALLSRNTSRPGLTGTARVDRNIDRLLRRVCPGDIVVLDVLDLDRITADALVEADIAAVINASPSVSGRYPNLGPEVLVTNGVTLIDETGPEIFKKVKDGSKIRLYEGGVYSGDRRLIRGTERTDHDIADLMREAKSGLAAHLEAFAGNTVEFIKSESPLLIDGIGIPDIEVDLRGNAAGQSSFLGIAFAVTDGNAHEAIYFRPFNFRAENPTQRAHAVQ